MTGKSPLKDKPWAERISRSGYFFGALLLHLAIFIMVATWVIFPAVYPPQDKITTYLLPTPPPKPPPPPVTPTPPVDIASKAPSAPKTPNVITGDNPGFVLPIPPINPATSGVATGFDPTPAPINVKPNTISPERLKKIKEFIITSRSPDDIPNSNSDPRNINARFPVYLASYADGDWACNTHLDNGQIDAGSLPNLIAKVNEWSHGHITAEVVPTPLNIGGPDLLEKKPPFIFFTGHKDFVLTDAEVQNLQAYVEMGGLIWGDNALAGKGSRFDVAFRREMKRVVPDLDKNFEPVSITDDLFAKSWWPIAQLPQGMNYYAEPIEHLDIDGQVAILYTPNDYSDLFSMRILPGDDQMAPTWVPRNATSPLFTSGTFWNNRTIFFRNFELPGSLAAQRLGMNIIGYILVRFDKQLLLTP